MNRVLLTGRLTRDPELRTTAGGKAVAQFSVASHEYVSGKEKSEFHTVVAWDRLAETCGRYLGKGQQVALEGRLQTRSWDDDKGIRHWKTEIVAGRVEMLSGRRKKDYATEIAASALEAQALAEGIAPDAGEPIAEPAFTMPPAGDDEEDELLDEAEEADQAVAA
jgi:single-strand DNA-binding protein